ncbi:hypothetical protein CN373_24490 [Bacillus cereus]|uniref:Group-specific protein n=1 Tax=Bacillus cereus TaxID=1396 RepID=A0AA44TDD3_BACCE|nr:hypothetical protein [Bacillus cereus]PFA13227.1 hypothetical protein CN373_24490 [Bacillus cereus]PFN06067.1 hypothetical protein COJ55_16075 [Bacillus cereus]PFR21359.1 hypothetical protein COK19_21935 [Bacillus cereus]PFR98664.1 hypothetical protein COK38_18680 [Bacillus cereus]PGZ12217.1 hypothetical protein COE46_24615 [Bacillus cereus]
MFYNNQHPYPQQPYYPQNQEQQYREQQFEDNEPQQQEFQHQQHSYLAQNTQEVQHHQHPYVAQENQYQQNPYLAQQFQETPYNGNSYAVQHFPYQQPQMYQPYQDPRVSPPAPTLDPTQPQILPPGPITSIPTEPTQQQIQQVVGTQFLPLKKPVLDFVKPWVEYGMHEAKHTSHKHAMTEVAAIMFLVGKGFNPTIAHYIVESWEKNEQF